MGFLSLLLPTNFAIFIFIALISDVDSFLVMLAHN